MTLLITFSLVSLFLFGFFWGGGLTAQGYLYSQPVERLAIRAALSALLVASFLTFWCWLDHKAPGRYDTFFEFTSYTTRPFDSFEAVRWECVPGAAARGKVEFKRAGDGSPIETIVKFQRTPGNGTPFVQTGTHQPFKLSDSAMMTTGIIVKLDEGEPVRFNADLQIKAEKRDQFVRFRFSDKNDKKSDAVTYTNEHQFSEEGGSRYIRADQMGILYLPSNSVVAIALALNAAHFLCWFVAFWLLLRFSFWHSLGFSALLGAVTMLAVMPLLFRPNRAVTPTPAVTTERRIDAAVFASLGP